MQPTTLNKIVSLFLVGGLVIFGIGAILLHQFGVDRLTDAIEPLAGEGGKTLFVVVSGILLLPVAAFAGAVSEGLTAMIIREPIRWIVRKNWALVFLRQTHAAKSYSFWKERFAEVAAASETLSGFPLGVNDRGIAVGLLYDKKLDSAIQWAESHYSMYVLASNFAFLSVIATVYLLLTGTWPNKAWSILTAAGMLYALLGVSIDRYLYSYEVALRQGTLSLHAQSTSPSSAKTDCGDRPVR
ncbi:MAG TPA: hypothetical protein VH988_33565 [Thermoanaerobaculia bacterium]|nr:hypothetical protein [Thermoanaerobaculia bacterium]